MHPVSHEDLMRHLDGELPPADHDRVDRHLAACTECRRELAVFRAMKGDLGMIDALPPHAPSVWDAVARRILRPTGWVLLVAGAAAWAAYGVYTFATGPDDAWEKLAVAVVVIGLLCLLAGIAWERYLDWQTDPYRKVER